jgi:hypothetical protein
MMNEYPLLGILAFLKMHLISPKNGPGNQMNPPRSNKKLLPPRKKALSPKKIILELEILH